MFTRPMFALSFFIYRTAKHSQQASVHVEIKVAKLARFPFRLTVFLAKLSSSHSGQLVFLQIGLFVGAVHQLLQPQMISRRQYVCSRVLNCRRG